jgi:hypothetical protein
VDYSHSSMSEEDNNFDDDFDDEEFDEEGEDEFGDEEAGAKLVSDWFNNPSSQVFRSIPSLFVV